MYIYIYPDGVFSVGSATSGGILDRAIEAEERKHGDFLRLVRLLLVMLMVFYFLWTGLCQSYFSDISAFYF